MASINHYMTNLMGNLPPAIGGPFSRMVKDITEEVQTFAAASLAQGVNSVDIDLLTDRDKYTVIADLPGFSKDDVNLEVLSDNRTIRLSAHRTKDDTKAYGCYSRRYGAFIREIVLPEDVDINRIQATAKDGVLTITIRRRVLCPHGMENTKRIYID